MTIYLAAPWVRRVEARGARDWFIAQGIACNSHWLDVADGASQEHEAMQDVEDVIAADALVVLNLEKSEGKAAELGMALMLSVLYGLRRKRIVVVGAPSNVFHYHPNVRIVATLEDARQYLER